MRSVRNSATGMAIHAPLMPRIRGRIISEMMVNTRVLQKEIMAETFPLDRAVKNPDEVILIPLNKKLMANSRKPTEASSQVRCSLVKIVTMAGEKKIAATTIIREETATKRKEIR